MAQFDKVKVSPDMERLVRAARQAALKVVLELLQEGTQLTHDSTIDDLIRVLETS